MTVEYTLNIQTSHGPIPLQAHPTDTDGLYVHRAHDSTDWMLTHHTGLVLGSFQYDAHAYNTAKAIGHLTDWTRTAEQLLANAAAFYLYEIHDAIHDNGGRFLYRPNGPAAHALAARGD